jgi:raffinose/stachyose/melibiose transport system substrate-binding protein
MRARGGARVARWVAAAIGAGVLATACTGGGGPARPASGGDANTITYLVGQPEDAHQLDLIKQDIAAFEKENPDAKVDLNVMPNDNLRTVLQTQLRSGEGPDVFGYDTGPGFAGVLAEAGLLYDLTDAYEKNEWPIYDWAKERVTFGGKVVGVPGQVEEIGIFYNKDLFAEHGIDEPRNLTELEAAAEKLKDAGITPFAFSDKEGWEAGHILSATLASSIGSDGVEALLSGKKAWNSPEVVAAIDLWFTDFRERGFLPPSPNAITYDNANALFYSGKAAMNLTGTWMISDINKTADFEVGFIPFPAKDGAGIFAGGLGGGTFVSANTASPELAVKFLDHLQSPEYGTWSVEKLNIIPAYPVDTTGITTNPLSKQVLEDTGDIASGEGDFGYNIDVLTTDVFNEAMWDGLQSALAGSASAKDVADALEEAFQSSTGE